MDMSQSQPAALAYSKLAIMFIRSISAPAVGLFLMLASYGKASSPAATILVLQHTLDRIGMHGLGFKAYLLVVALVVFEILLGVWLLSGWRARAARRVALGTLGVFTLFLIALVFDPAAPPCACTGWIRLADDAHTANLLGVGRNLVLIALLAAAPARPAASLRVAGSP